MSSFTTSTDEDIEALRAQLSGEWVRKPDPALQATFERIRGVTGSPTACKRLGVDEFNRMLPKSLHNKGFGLAFG